MSDQILHWNSGKWETIPIHQVITEQANRISKLRQIIEDVSEHISYLHMQNKKDKDLESLHHRIQLERCTPP